MVAADVTLVEDRVPCQGRRWAGEVFSGYSAFVEAAEVYIGMVVVMISVGVRAYLAESSGVILRQGCWETGWVSRC